MNYKLSAFKTPRCLCKNFKVKINGLKTQTNSNLHFFYGLTFRFYLLKIQFNIYFFNPWGESLGMSVVEIVMGIET